MGVQRAYNEDDILKQLDSAFKGIPNEYYPNGNKGDIKYNFILDLEHGYCATASSRIHLYADKDRAGHLFSKKAGIKIEAVTRKLNWIISEIVLITLSTNIRNEII